MPYQVRKQDCKKSDDTSGTYVVQKKKSGKWKKASCHDSKEKANSSIRARKVNEEDIIEEVLIARILERILSINNSR